MMNLCKTFFLALIAWALSWSSTSVAIELTINTPEGDNYPLNGFLAHEEFFTNLQTLIGNKIKAATEALLSQSKVDIGLLLPNINAKEYTVLQILHSLADSDTVFTNQLLELYSHMCEDKQNSDRWTTVMSDWLKSNLAYTPNFMYTVAKSIARQGKNGLKLLPQSIVSEILSLMDSSAVFMEASRIGDIEVMRWLLQSNANLDLSLALETAWYQERTDIVTLLIENNATVKNVQIINVSNRNNESLLHVGAASHVPHFVKHLIQHGADVNVLDVEGSSPLYLAVSSNDSIIAQLLIDSGSDVNLKTVTGNTALHEAVMNGNVEIFETLMGSGSIIDKKNNHGISPFLISEKYVITGIIQHLFRNKMIIPDEKDFSLLYLMKCDRKDKSYSDDFENILRISEMAKRMMIRALKDSYINTDFKSKLLNTTLVNLIGPLAQSLVNLGASLRTKSKSTETIFLNAVNKGDKEIVTLMLDEGVSANTKTDNGTTALHVAASSASIEVFHILLERGADIHNAVTHNGWTLLHAASAGGNVGIVEYLLSRGCKINATNSDNYTPLYAAAAAGRHKVISVLVEHRADMTRKGALSPLHAAVIAGSVESVNSLVNLGANIEEETTSKETPLIVAVKRGKQDVVKALLDNGANLNVRDYIGRTPLHLAVQSNSSTMVKLLLDRHHRVDVLDLDRRTLLDIAEKNNMSIIQLFMTRGKKGSL